MQSETQEDAGCGPRIINVVVSHENNEDQEVVDKDESISNDDEEEEDGNNIVDKNGDDNGWITSGNIDKVKQKMGFQDELSIDHDKVKCVCLTTDFAMQVSFPHRYLCVQMCSIIVCN